MMKNNMRKKTRFTPISFQEKLMIKSFCERAKRQAFFVDLIGLNELIELFGLISTSDTSDYQSPGQQLNYMWLFVYSFYKDNIEGVDLTQLRMRKLYMQTKKHSRIKLKYINYRNLEELKTCTKCGEHKLGNEFYWNKDRLQACCKKCMYKIYASTYKPKKKSKIIN